MAWRTKWNSSLWSTRPVMVLPCPLPSLIPPDLSSGPRCASHTGLHLSLHIPSDSSLSFRLFLFGEGMHFCKTEFRPSHPLPFSSRKLSHPKLVQLYGVCLEQAPICLVFEFMEHGCLSDYLRNQRGLFAAETLLGMCLDVCEGMAYLEEACVIHRDLVRGCRAHIYKSGRKGHIPLKCRATHTGNMLIHNKSQTSPVHSQILPSSTHLGIS